VHQTTCTNAMSSEVEPVLSISQDRSGEKEDVFAYTPGPLDEAARSKTDAMPAASSKTKRPSKRLKDDLDDIVRLSTITISLHAHSKSI
jgi:hypothetical protein